MAATGTAGAAAQDEPRQINTAQAGPTPSSPFSEQNPRTACFLLFFFLGQSQTGISGKPKQRQVELRNDWDREFLLEGFKHGFRLIEEDSSAEKVEVNDHTSAHKYSDIVEKEVLDQIEKGYYVIANSKPDIVSPLAAMPKTDGDVRLLHAASGPRGTAINDYSSLDEVRFQTLEDACKLAKPGFWCAKVDLKSAYRSVAVHPDDFRVRGLKWDFQGKSHPSYMFDVRLPFGSNVSLPYFTDSLTLLSTLCRDGVSILSGLY